MGGSTRAVSSGQPAHARGKDTSYCLLSSRREQKARTVFENVIPRQVDQPSGSACKAANLLAQRGFYDERRRRPQPNDGGAAPTLEAAGVGSAAQMKIRLA